MILFDWLSTRGIDSCFIKWLQLQISCKRKRLILDEVAQSIWFDLHLRIADVGYTFILVLDTEMWSQ